MLLVLAILFLGCAVVTTRYYWRRAVGESEQASQDHWLKWWMIKGLGVPLLLWTIFNLGLLPGVPALLPPIDAALAAGNWFPVFANATAGAIWVIGTYWSALTLGWLAVNWYQRIERRNEFLGVAILWLLVMLFFGALFLFALGWMGLGLVFALWFGAIVHNTLSLAPVKLPPNYIRAIARMNFDKYNEAEWEIIKELEQCEHDFDGWMLLAELYATRFNDLPAAEQTISDLCDDPNITASQLAVALNRLADWELKIGENPDAARRVLEMISRRLPGTHLERMARQRIEKLPATREELLRQREAKTVRLPAEESSAPAAPIAEEFARTMARNYVEQLNRNPDNVAARDQFARLLAESLHEPALALEQLGLLLAMSGHSDEQRAEWMLLMAGWQAKLLQDFTGAEQTLRRIILEAPQGRFAFEAQRQLYLLKLDDQLRARPAATSVPAGAAE